MPVPVQGRREAGIASRPLARISSCSRCLDIHHNRPASRDMYGINPFSAQKATNDVDPAHAPSIFGALPYPGNASATNPPLHALVTFRFTSLSPTILDSKVVGPNNETCYRVVTGGQAHTFLQDRAGRNVALVDWQRRPTVEAQIVGPKQLVSQWLQVTTDRSARTMAYGGVYYVWAPLGRFLHLFVLGSSEWLVRVTRSPDAVVLELTAQAVELGLIHSAVLATLLLQSGKNID